MNNLEKKIEAIIICFRYLDYLSLTLPRTLEVFDHVIVVTLPNDPVETYCKSLNSDKLTVISTNIMFEDGANWNKGAGIAQGLQYLKYNQFFCTIDSDIYLHSNFHSDFFNFAKDKEMAYGSRRFLLPTRKDFDDFVSEKTTEQDYLLLRGAIYGFFAIFSCESAAYQNFLKKHNNIGYIYWIGENHTIDWLYLREWAGATMVYNPEPTTKYPDFHYDQHNDYLIGLAKELPFHVAHLGDPGQTGKEKELSFK